MARWVFGEEGWWEGEDRCLRELSWSTNRERDAERVQESNIKRIMNIVLWSWARNNRELTILELINETMPIAWILESSSNLAHKPVLMYVYTCSGEIRVSTSLYVYPQWYMAFLMPIHVHLYLFMYITLPHLWISHHFSTVIKKTDECVPDICQKEYILCRKTTLLLHPNSYCILPLLKPVFSNGHHSKFHSPICFPFFAFSLFVLSYFTLIALASTSFLPFCNFILAFARSNFLPKSCQKTYVRTTTKSPSTQATR